LYSIKPRVRNRFIKKLTRSRVSFFMNRFRKMGFIEYDGRIRVHKSLLNVILHDRLPNQNAEKPLIMTTPRVQPTLKRPGKRVRS
jgi:hypothetical protein